MYTAETTQLESDLQALRAAASRKPDTLEAADRALVKLRSQRQQVAAAFDASSRGGPSRMGFEDLLRPFLLALNHTSGGARMASVALASVQRLLSAGVLGRADRENVTRVVLIQERRCDQEIDVKVLQTLPLLYGGDGGSLVTGMLSQAVGACLRLHARESPIIRHTAEATLMQILSGLLERAGAEVLDAAESEAGIEGAEFSETMDAALSFLSELCEHVAVEPKASGLLGSFVRSAPSQRNDGGEDAAAGGVAVLGDLGGARVPRTLGLEMIESVLTAHSAVFLLPSSPFGAVVRRSICPLVQRLLKGQSDFPLMVRLLRTVAVLLCDLRALLPLRDREKLVVSLLGMIDDDSDDGTVASKLSIIVTPTWHRVLTLETMHLLCVHPDLMRELYEYHDASAAASEATSSAAAGAPPQRRLFESIVETLSRFVSRTMATSQAGAASEVDKITAHASANSTRPTKGLELLGESEAPPSSVALVVLLAAECLVSITDGLAATAAVACGAGGPGESAGREASGSSSPVLMVQTGLFRKRVASTAKSRGGQELSRRDSRESSPVPQSSASSYNTAAASALVLEGMVGVTWRPLLTSLELLLQTCSEESMVQFLLKACTATTHTCGVLGMVEARDAFILALCRFSLPEWNSANSLASFSCQVLRGRHHHGSAVGSTDTEAGAVGTETRLSRKQLQSLKALFNIAHGLGEILGATSWHIVLETLEQLDFILHAWRYHAATHRAAVAAAVATGGAGAEGADEGGPDFVAEPEMQYDSDMQQVTTLLSALFASSAHFSNDALADMLGALTEISLTSIAHAATARNPRPSTSEEAPQKAHKQQHRGGGVGGQLGGSAVALARGALSSLGLDSLHLPLGWQRAAAAAAGSSSSGGNSGGTVVAVDGHTARATYRFPPFALEKLVESAEQNAFRVAVFWDTLSAHLLIVASSTQEERLRTFGVQALARLLRAALRAPASPGVAAMKQSDLLRPMFGLLQSPLGQTREEAIESLQRCIEDAGHVIHDAWPKIIEELRRLAAETSSLPLVRASFQIVQLVVDEYMATLRWEWLKGLAECLFAFSAQTQDVNISLTAVNHLWAMCDLALAKRDESEGDGGSEATEAMLGLWMGVFTSLAHITRDPRPEVRACSLRTLCSNIVARSAHLRETEWQRCMRALLVPLWHDVEERFAAAAAEGEAAVVLGEKLGRRGERMMVHHSRNTKGKQWGETRVTTINNAARVVQAAYTQPVVRREAWFGEVWRELADLLGRSVRSPTQREVSLGGISSLNDLALFLVRRCDDGTGGGDAPSDEELWESLWQVYEGVTTDPAASPMIDLDSATALVQGLANVCAEATGQGAARPWLLSCEALRKVLGILDRLLAANPPRGSTLTTLQRAVTKLLPRLAPMDLAGWVALMCYVRERTEPDAGLGPSTFLPLVDALVKVAMEGGMPAEARTSLVECIADAANSGARGAAASRACLRHLFALCVAAAAPSAVLSECCERVLREYSSLDQSNDCSVEELDRATEEVMSVLKMLLDMKERPVIERTAIVELVTVNSREVRQLLKPLLL